MLTTLVKELSNEQLADAYGNAKAKEKSAKLDTKVLGSEFKRRRRKRLFGNKFILTLSDSSSTSVDKEGLRKLLGTKLNKYITSTPYKKILISLVKEQSKAA